MSMKWPWVVRRQDQDKAKTELAALQSRVDESLSTVIPTVDVDFLGDSVLALAVETAEVARMTALQFSTELFKAKQRISTIFNTVTDSVLLLDNKGSIVSTNPSARVTFGDVKGPMCKLLENPKAYAHAVTIECRRFYKYLTSLGCTEPAALRSAYMSYVASGRAYFVGTSREIKAFNARAHLFDFEFTAHLLNPEDVAEEWLLIIVGRDVTEKSRVARELQRSHRLQDAILRSVPSPMFYATQGYTIDWANPLMVAMFGEITGKDYRQVFPDLAETFATCGHASLQIRLESNLGLRHFLVSQARVCVDKCVNDCGVVVTFVDVTDVETHKSKIAEQERDIQAIIDTLPDLVFVVNKNSIERHNATAAPMLNNPEFMRHFGHLKVSAVKPMVRDSVDHMDGKTHVTWHALQVSLGDERALVVVRVECHLSKVVAALSPETPSHMFVFDADGNFVFKTEDFARKCSANNIRSLENVGGNVRVGDDLMRLQVVRAENYYVGFANAISNP